MQLVVADVTGEPVGRWGDDVEVVSLDADAGWAAARNAGLRRARGHVVVVLDPSLEPVGEVLGGLVSALDDPAIGVAGPFGIVTRDLRSFEEASRAGPADAIEAYLMAFRRDVLREVGGFDERFRWYRSADLEWSFRVKDAGYRVEVVAVPVSKHVHRMWKATSPEDRARLSKRNFSRFLERYRDRWDLVLAGPPTDPR
jgi:GT2 family glycosyltransferase